LKICIMVHVEDSQHWNDRVQNTGTPGKYLQQQLGMLATVVARPDPFAPGNPDRGAKVSLQVDRWYLDDADPSVDPPSARYPLGSATSLSWILDEGGNFWCQCHCATYDHLHTVRAVVMSAYEGEGGAQVPSVHVAGRSGGADLSELLKGNTPRDWLSITQAEGMRLMNSSVMNYYANVVQSLRPYAMPLTEMALVHGHDAAPGPWDNKMSIGTMRQRPFWMELASVWHDHGDLDQLFPISSFSDTGSVMMIPQPDRWYFDSAQQRRTAYREREVSQESLEYLLTEVWTAANLMTRFQSSITNAWYTQLIPSQLNDGVISMVGNFVSSVNKMLNVYGNGTPGDEVWGEWKNMNEIGSLFADSTSKWH